MWRRSNGNPKRCDWAASEPALPFDMERGPLLRAMLVQLGDEEFRLYLFLHHIIFDGFSMYNVFLPELVTVYNVAAGRAGLRRCRSCGCSIPTSRSGSADHSTKRS